MAVAFSPIMSVHGTQIWCMLSIRAVYVVYTGNVLPEYMSGGYTAKTQHVYFAFATIASSAKLNGLFEDQLT
jgi:hypothetical protein